MYLTVTVYRVASPGKHFFQTMQLFPNLAHVYMLFSFSQNDKKTSATCEKVLLVRMPF